MTGFKKLTNKEWNDIREKMTQRYFNMSVDEFVEWFNQEQPTEDEHEHLMGVLVWFPELD